MFTLDAKQREAKVGYFREWLFTSLTQNRPTIQKQFCLSEVKQPLAKFATDSNCRWRQILVASRYLRVQCQHILTL